MARSGKKTKSGSKFLSSTTVASSLVDFCKVSMDIPEALVILLLHIVEVSFSKLEKSTAYRLLTEILFYSPQAYRTTQLDHCGIYWGECVSCPSKNLPISWRACGELAVSSCSIWGSIEQEEIVGHSISAQCRIPLWAIFDPELSIGAIVRSEPLPTHSSFLPAHISQVSDPQRSLEALFGYPWSHPSFFFQQKVPSIHLLHFS